ncbi:hypothetical protein [Serratia marcescens]|uniref:hypothetical protein n=1 Tax=Serratia TaxID=613 RepID=UPI001F149A33|nr:hypothetical protein [Serratia marcescens]HBB6712717.1 hypothetical protein [Serratia marcescens]
MKKNTVTVHPEKISFGALQSEDHFHVSFLLNSDINLRAGEAVSFQLSREQAEEFLAGVDDALKHIAK